MHTYQPSCRSCGGVGLTPILSLGKTPLANRLLTAAELAYEEPTYPIDLVLCPNCGLVQITETVPVDELFDDGACLPHRSIAEREQSRGLVERLITERHLNARSLVIEIGSLDGQLLSFYRQSDLSVLGIEPAAHFARQARVDYGVPTLARSFSRETAVELDECGQPADVVHARSVLGYVADVNGFVAGLRTVLKPSGVAVVEVPYVRDLVERVEFDAIYHEHLSYFSLTSLAPLFARHGLQIEHVDRLNIGGGTLRLFVGRQVTADATVSRMLAEEKELGVERPEYYREFALKVEQLRGELRTLLQKLKAQGCRIVAYGASAEGTTLLNYCGLGRDTVEFVVDRDPAKQGRYTPGSHLAVYPPEKLLETKADYALLASSESRDGAATARLGLVPFHGQWIIATPELQVA